MPDQDAAAGAPDAAAPADAVRTGLDPAGTWHRPLLVGREGLRPGHDGQFPGQRAGTGGKPGGTGGGSEDTLRLTLQAQPQRSFSEATLRLTAPGHPQRSAGQVTSHLTPPGQAGRGGAEAAASLRPARERAQAGRSAHRGRRRELMAACAGVAVVAIGLGAVFIVHSPARHHAPQAAGGHPARPASVTPAPARSRAGQPAGAVAPGVPEGFRVTGFNHGASLSWMAPGSTAGQPVSYSLAWPGGTRSSITGTSAAVTGLANGRQYIFRLTASDAAGSGAAATATVSLIPPPHDFRIIRNQDAVLFVDSRPAPAGSGSSSAVGTVGRGQSPTVTVQCQVRGATATDPFDHAAGDVWDRVTFNGQTGYISDMYVSTASSQAAAFSAFSDPPLWQCS